MRFWPPIPMLSCLPARLALFRRSGVLTQKSPFPFLSPPLLLLFLVLILHECLFPAYGWGLASTPPIPEASIQLQPFSTHTFHHPIFLTAAPGHPEGVFVVEQEGYIHFVRTGQVSNTPFLDIHSKVSSGGEQGLLGLAFHPNFLSNGRFFVNYTRTQDGATVIAEFQAPSPRTVANPQERILLVIPQPYSNHNGGMLAFGPDQYLYIGTGDGGSGGDPDNRAQNPQDLLGKLLRIDVDRFFPYAIPPDNPFLKGGGQPEIFALGLRNPWRFSFDRQTGDLWAADVGQNNWEEVDLIQKGKNYGWRLLEGRHCYNPASNCERAPSLVPPVTEYRHEQGRCSVTGGYVYRGASVPTLAGIYVFGDFCTGEILGYHNGGTWLLTDTNLHISSFGEDSDGELYVVGYGGQIFRVMPNVVAPQP